MQCLVRSHRRTGTSHLRRCREYSLKRGATSDLTPRKSADRGIPPRRRLLSSGAFLSPRRYSSSSSPAPFSPSGGLAGAAEAAQQDLTVCSIQRPSSAPSGQIRLFACAGDAAAAADRAAVASDKGEAARQAEEQRRRMGCVTSDGRRSSGGGRRRPQSRERGHLRP